MVKEKKFPPERLGSDYAPYHQVTITYTDDSITITLTRDKITETVHPLGILKLTEMAQLRLIRMSIDAGVPKDKYVLLTAVMILLMRGMYFRSESNKSLSAVFTVTFLKGVCRFVSYDDSGKRLDYQVLLAKSASNKQGDSLKTDAELLGNLCSEWVVTDTQGLKYSGSFEFVPVAP